MQLADSHTKQSVCRVSMTCYIYACKYNGTVWERNFLHLCTNFKGCQYGIVGVQEGSMRCDVNVSVRPSGQQELGTKVEVKNMNSFSAMQKAIDFEIARQVCAPAMPAACSAIHL